MNELYLIDTQVLIFLGCGYTDRIGNQALSIFKNSESKLAVSRISFWEIAIKVNIGKLHIPIGLEGVIYSTRQASIEIVPVRDSHILFFQSLKVQESHKDPFDRYIISTAICEEMNVISNDVKFDLYPDIHRIW